MATLELRTNARTQMLDITAEVRRIVAESGLEDALCVVYVPHTTAAVTINENADPDVARDMLMELNKLVPFEDGYRHGEGNSAAHIKSSMFNASCTVPIVGGRLLLGTWQGIYFCEFDGPRSRRVHVVCR
jgi:secondary thiamine-phosphate synthase enzyme